MANGIRTIKCFDLKFMFASNNLQEMWYEKLYVPTSNCRIFYTSISLNDRFKQYHQVFRPIGYRQDYRGYFMNRRTRRRRNMSYQSWNRFEKTPVIWGSNFYEHSSSWNFCRESPWDSPDHDETEIYQPVENIKRKRKKRNRRTKNAARKTLTKEELDDELDQYMINVPLDDQR